MNAEKRYLSIPIKKDLADKMVFLGGPRQVGKTTLAMGLFGYTIAAPGYLNWDDAEDRKLILQNRLPLTERALILDEIHKYKFWRTITKALYDKHRDKIKILVTGSARLDHFRKGGDSLVGRYHYYRLHPFSLNELNRRPTASDLQELLAWGGFPEPFTKANLTSWRRWQRERISRVVRQDLYDLESVKELSLIELLVEILPSRVGSPLSVASLREDLQVAHQSVERYIGLLDALYMTFRILPYGVKKIRAVKKEKKLYFWDWSQVAPGGARFENLVASHLLKYCHFYEDTQGYKMELRYIRDIDKREIDFVVLQEGKPLFAVECKTGEKNLSPHINYFRLRTDIPKFYQVHEGKSDYGSEETGRVLPFVKFCQLENLV